MYIRILHLNPFKMIYKTGLYLEKWRGYNNSKVCGLENIYWEKRILKLTLR